MSELDHRRVFYADDSHRGGLGKVFAVAGYLGYAGVWQTFDETWRWALDHNRPRPLTEFKAADCENRRNEFADWSPDECQKLRRDLVSCISSAAFPAMLGLGAGVVISEIEPTQGTTTPRGELSWAERKWGYQFASIP